MTVAVPLNRMSQIPMMRRRIPYTTQQKPRIRRWPLKLAASDSPKDIFSPPLLTSLAQAYVGLKGISFASVCPFWNIAAQRAPRSTEIIGTMRARIRKSLWRVSQAFELGGTTLWGLVLQ